MNMAAFSERLKKLREKSGLSQSELATRLNIAKSTLAMYETGKREPNFDMVQRIAEFFDISIDYLLCRTDDPTPPIEEKEKINIMDLKKALMEKELTWGGQKLKKEDQEVLRKIILAVLEREGFFKEKS